MAILQPVVEINKRLLPEVASSLIGIRRVVAEDASVTFPTSITYVTTLYEVDALGNKLSRHSEENQNVFDLTPQEVIGFFTTPITVGGTDTILGDLIGYLTDQLIQARLTPPQE